MGAGVLGVCCDDVCWVCCDAVCSGNGGYIVGFLPPGRSKSDFESQLQQYVRRVEQEAMGQDAAVDYTADVCLVNIQLCQWIRIVESLKNKFLT